jgi:hypothetical protein
MSLLGKWLEAGLSGRQARQERLETPTFYPVKQGYNIINNKGEPRGIQQWRRRTRFEDCSLMSTSPLNDTTVESNPAHVDPKGAHLQPCVLSY